MFFLLNENFLAKYGLNKADIESLIKSTARQRVYNYEFRSTELQLDEYCMKHYSMSLKSTCLRLIENCSVTTDNKNNFIVIFNDSRLDTIASTIAYGLPNMSGSGILRNAFTE